MFGLQEEFGTANMAALFGMPAWLLGFIAAMIVMFIVVLIVLYVYCALVLMTIAKKTNTKNPWLAWIPIANLYLMTQIGKVPWWTIFGLLLGSIPFIGGILVAVLMGWWWWKISEARQRPGWWGILLIIPIVNFVIMGILAWSDVKTQ